jgi:outer membrane protein assembly factor BamA
LLKKNEIEVLGKHDLSSDELNSTIRQQPNSKTIGLKLRLGAYNWDWSIFDSTRIANKRIRKNMDLRDTNRDKIAKQNRINSERIERARSRGKETYSEKIIPLKDTLEPKRFFAEWFRYKYGERPIIFDSIQYNRSVNQLQILLRKRGYYHGNVTAKMDTNFAKRTITPTYTVLPGTPYLIDSVQVICSNAGIRSAYSKYARKADFPALLYTRFDSDALDNHRQKVAKFLKDDQFYGFSPSNIVFQVDTFTLADRGKKDKVILSIEFLDRPIKHPTIKDSVTYVKHQRVSIRNVYFHISDTSYFTGNFKAHVQSKGLSVLDEGGIRCLDTLFMDNIMLTKSEKKKRGIKPLDKDTVNVLRRAYFLYNGELGFDPEILEAQNYLEATNKYKEYYLERTYTRLNQLGLFQTIKPYLEEVKGTPYLDVHYYLVPLRKQSFSFEPRSTNSNGILGLSSTLNYTNKNIFRGSERLTLSFSGGFESQPPVFDEGQGGKLSRTFNTFEISPSIKLDLPGLFPIKSTRLSKRQRPRTVLSAAYSFQKRFEFTRSSFQLNYLYKFYAGKTQVFQVMAIVPPVIKFVSMDNLSDGILQNLINNNDAFLRNTYSDQFIWQDLKLTFEYNNKDKDSKKGNTSVLFNTSLDHAGFFLNLVSNKADTTDAGQRKVFGVPYSNFVRIDNELIVKLPHTKKTSSNFRLVAGGGISYGNSKTSMPFDYSFFAGGTNDNRGWKTRTLGPGSYKYYLDEDRTITQLADIRISTTYEYRFSMGSTLKGALFMDAGNIWTLREDPNRIGSQISKDFWKQLSIAGGVGLRADFEFFILRLDLGLPFSNPALNAGNQWFFNGLFDANYRQAYYSEGIGHFGAKATALFLEDNPGSSANSADIWKYIKDYQLMPRPFQPVLSFGIGYPF